MVSVELQNRCGAASQSWVGSTPTHSRQRLWGSGSWPGGALDENETRFATFRHRLAELLDREALDGRDAAALDPAFAAVVLDQMAGESEVRREM